ncbi:MAG: CapA family protein [Candidatus Omnitrophota bacterium]
MISGISTPYNARESISWLVRNITGLSRKNAGIVKPIPNSHVFNAGLKPEYKVVFVGDIVPAPRGRVKFDRDLRQFASGSDCLIANFAGTITGPQTKAVPFDQAHTPQIRDTLADFFPPEKTYISVANNHAGDFGKKVFLESVELLRSRGFGVFGWNECPYADINDDLRVVSGTMWSNRPCDYVCRLDGVERHARPGAFNFLYPHFGYELELYPRPEIVRLGRELVRKFDAVIASHPHCPQPVTAEPIEGINRILAYSLGDFCTGAKMKKYQYGTLLKVELGRNGAGKLLAGKVEWYPSRCTPMPGGDFVVKKGP